MDNFSKIREEASLSGLYDHKLFVPMVWQLGEYYNWPRMAPEANGHGVGFCEGMFDKGYPNLFLRQEIISGLVTKRVGWVTTGAARIGAAGTKIYALTELQAILPIIETYDQDLVRGTLNNYFTTRGYSIHKGS